MRIDVRIPAALIAAAAVLAPSLWSQAKPAPGGATPPGAAGGAALQGLSYAQAEWWKYLTTLPSDKNRQMLCYELAYTNSAAQPFILQSTDKIQPDHAEQVECFTPDRKRALMMHARLVVAIDVRHVDPGQLKIWNINLITQQGTSLNPTPVRPGIGSSGVTKSGLTAEQINAIEKIYYLIWPNELAGDVLPSLSINVVYTPATPGARWQKCTVYPAGSVVTTSSVPGHYFVTSNGGVSLSEEPKWNELAPATVIDGHVTWQHIGPTLLLGMPKAKPWMKDSSFDVGDVVIAPTNGQHYLAIATVDDRKVGDSLPQFRISPASYTDEISTTNKCPTSASYPIQWIDVGTMAPPSVSNIQGPDQLLNLLTLQLPQTHTLFSYNIATGVVYSRVRDRTFALPSGLTGMVTTSNQVQTSSTHVIDAVLALTAYPRPIDAEWNCGFTCLWTTWPGATVGLSIISPSSRFYGGISFEIFRSTQLLVGYGWAKVTELPQRPVAISSSATTAVTVQKFSGGLFAGLTFNISGFVQSVFK